MMSLPETTRVRIRVETIPGLHSVAAQDWDALAAGGDPFLRHAFLAGLEQHGCLTGHGWTPVHLLAFLDRQLVGALPLYRKSNSFGEFVFDWAWADAYERSGGAYYPKLVSAIPFTPVAGPRLLIHPEMVDAASIRQALIEGAIELGRREGLSSVHFLFPAAADGAALDGAGLLRRQDCQYHWYNDEYRQFDDFLATLNSKRRKEIRRERRTVAESGLVIDVLPGADIRDRHWEIFHAFYCSTFERKWGRPRLTLDFFRHLSADMPDTPLLLMARDGQRYVAGAFTMIGQNSLYGRHWGCQRDYRNLHFELCYYQTIEFCIEAGLAHLDAGAQGEHKIQRGFVPVPTHSYHWIADNQFRRAVADYLERERVMVDEYIHTLTGHSAYKHGDRQS